MSTGLPTPSGGIPDTGANTKGDNMVLSDLVEKKDILAYIHYRVAATEQINIKEYPAKDREFQRQRILGRIKELKRLKVIVLRNDIKAESKKLAQYLKTKTV